MKPGERPSPRDHCVPVRAAVLLLASVLLLATASCDGPPPAGPQVPDTVTALFALEPDAAGFPACSGWFDPACDDDDPCTIQACIDGICRYAASFDADCCNTDADCDDGAACSQESCSPDHTCVRTVLDGLPGCCTTHADCQPGGKSDDGDVCNIDYCMDSVCQHMWKPSTCDPAQGGTCQSDDNPCTQDLCTCDPACPTNCQCEHTKIPLCCNTDKDCNDNKFCTKDTCVNGLCVFTMKLSCCSTDADCADDNPCNLDECVNHVCRYGPNPALPDCCKTGADCNDNIACTAEYCDTDVQTCVKSLVPDQTPKCCWTDAECDDNDPWTLDKCVKNQCANNMNPTLCDPTHPCNDNNPCTSDSCANKKCTYTAISGCCTSDAGCNVAPMDDGAPCTLGKCINNKCTFQPVPECCTTEADCGPGGTWDDENLCTADLCIARVCRHVRDSECCLSDAECDDGDCCTGEACVENQCIVLPWPIGPGACTISQDCDDNVPCTLNYCKCNCCLVIEFDPAVCCALPENQDSCTDTDPCTCDRCLFDKCRHFTWDLAPKDCGIPIGCCTMQSDCPPSTNPCVVTSCYEGKCDYTKVDPCALELPFVATFNPCSAMDEYWKHTEPEDGSGEWWTCGGKGDLGPDLHVVFEPEGEAVEPLDALIASEYLTFAGSGVVTMQWDWALAHGEGKATVGAYLINWSGMGEPEGSQSLLEVDVEADLHATHNEAQLPGGFDAEFFRIGFGVSAASSAAVKSFEVDDVRVCGGHPPKWSGAPGPQDVFLGEAWTVELAGWNPDAGEEMGVSFVGGSPSFAELGDPVLDPDSGDWTVTLFLVPSLPKDVDEYVLTIRASDGCLVDDILVPVVVFGL